MSADRDLAAEIHFELVSDRVIDAALEVWAGIADLPDRVILEAAITHAATVAIEAVLARRQREAARTGPWEGGHHFQEEDGYPGSLLPPKRGTP